MTEKEKFQIQESQYEFPYHYLVDLDKYSNFKRLSWGVEYYCYMRHTIDYIEKLEYKSLLDVGCGDGRLISELAKRQPEKIYQGIDLSKPAIDLAKGLNHKLGNARFDLCDVKDLDEHYDVVVLNEVLEHVPSEEMAEFCLNAGKRISDKGKLVITVPAKNVPLNRKHYRHYDLEAVKQHFGDLKLIEREFLFKYSKWNKYFYEFFKMINAKKFEYLVAKKLMFNAGESNCSHIFAVFTK